MKKIGFITSPITSGHAVRGIGFYTKRLLPHLKSQASSHDLEIIEISDPSQLTTHNLQLLHYPYLDLFTHTLPIIKSTKTVVTIHDVIYLEFPDHYPPGIKGSLNLALQKLSLQSVDRVITDSYASVNSIKKHLHVPDEKLKLVYLAADPIFKKIAKPKNKYKLPKKFVLYVGDINYNKNIPNLVLACQKADLPLVIVGQQAAKLEKLDLNHPELSHLKSHYSLLTTYPQKLGFVSDEDLVDIYNLATVYCQASFSEGFGLPVLEALACGTPVACSNRSSLPEIAGGAASYFDPTDPNQIADAIQMARPNGEIAQAKKLSWEKTAHDTLLVYSELI